MDMDVPAIGLFQSLGNGLFLGNVFQEIMVAPQTAVILSDGEIPFPAHSQICPHIVGTVVDS